MKPVEVDQAPQIAREAEVHLQEGRAAEAARLYAQITGEQRDDLIATREALAWVAADEVENALQVLEAEDGPVSSDAAVLRAMIAWQQDDAEAAYAHITEAASLDASNAAAWALKGEFDLRLGEHADALAALHRADRNLEDCDALKLPVVHNLASAQFIVGRFERAYDTYGRYRALKGTVDREDVLVSGMLAYTMRDHEQAINHWSRLDAESRTVIAGLLADESDAYEILIP
jgi:tetratricopeptide (TPR) repeat protein